MTDILHLPGWKATATRHDGPELVIQADYIEPAVACIKCGVIDRLYRHGTKVLNFRDTPMHGKTVMLEGTAQRYRCQDCGETFVQPLMGVEPGRRMTSRCVEFIRSQCLRDTFTRTAELVGCTEGTVRNIAGDQIKHLDGQFSPYLPAWLGIDETQLDRGMRCVLTDVGRRTPIDILIDRDKPTVARWLYQFPDRSAVKGVAMDMWRPYRDTVKAVLGEHVPVVIDKFHVVRMANQAVDKVRIRVQREKDTKTRVAWKRSKVQLVKRPENLSESQRFNLDMWLANEPEVAEAYRLKEAFFAIYDKPKDEAIAAYDAFLKSVPASMKTEFGDLTRAMKNWRTEILAYFDYPDHQRLHGGPERDGEGHQPGRQGVQLRGHAGPHPVPPWQAKVPASRAAGRGSDTSLPASPDDCREGQPLRRVRRHLRRRGAARVPNRRRLGRRGRLGTEPLLLELLRAFPHGGRFQWLS